MQKRYRDVLPTYQLGFGHVKIRIRNYEPHGVDCTWRGAHMRRAEWREEWKVKGQGWKLT
jgi:hypothetical protein